MTESTELMCPICGAQLSRLKVAEQAVCPTCGAQLIVELQAVAIPPAVTLPVCPLCGETDSIEKVSSIYASEISRSHCSFPWVQTQTKLGKQLRPPENPRSAEQRAIGLFNLGVMLCGLGVFVGICLFGPDPLRVPPSELVIVRRTMGAEATAVYAITIAAAALVVGVLLVVGAALFHVGYKRMRSWRERLPFEKGRYDRALRRWERLCYCPRDDGVFFPGEMRLVPIAEMRELLHGDQTELAH